MMIGDCGAATATAVMSGFYTVVMFFHLVHVLQVIHMYL